VISGPDAVFVDTSVWYALSDQGEAGHARIRRAVEQLRSSGRRLVTSNFVVAETHALIIGRLGRFEALRYLRSMLRGDLDLDRVTEMDERRAVEIIEHYADKAFSYTDATSFAIIERRGISTAFSLDRHFAQFGLTTLGLDS